MRRLPRRALATRGHDHRLAERGGALDRELLGPVPRNPVSGQADSSLRMGPDQRLRDDDARAVVGNGGAFMKPVAQCQSLAYTSAKLVIVWTSHHSIVRQALRRLSHGLSLSLVQI